MARLRPLRGPGGAALVALPHRDERVPRHARRPRSAARGRWISGPRASPIAANLNTLPEVTWIEPMPDGLRRAGGRSGGGGRRARDDPARLRRRAAAPSAAPARGADPLRGAALEGGGGRRAPRHERCVRQQRAPAGARDARGERRERRGHRALGRRGGRRAARPLRRGLRALRHGRAHGADPRGRDAVDAAVRPVAQRPRRHLQLVGRPRRRLPRLAGDPHDGGERRAGVRAVQAERDRRGLRAVGAPGARDRGRPRSSSSRSSSTRRPLFPLFGLPARLES